MASFRFEVPLAAGVLSDFFADMPREVRTFLRKGFAALAKIPPDRFPEILKVVVERLPQRYPAAEAGLAKTLGIPTEEAKPLLAAAAVFASLISSGEVEVDDLVGQAKTAEVINGNDIDGALQFSRVAASNRAAIQGAMERSGIASAVLPSLSEFETTVDLRLGFEKGRVCSSIPLAIVHVDTDAEGQKLWLQLTKGEVERIVEDLQGVIRQMEDAEKWTQE